MVPGISSAGEARLAALLDRRVTDITAASLEQLDFTLLSGTDAQARALGIEALGDGELTVVVTDPERRLGEIRIATASRDTTVFFDNRGWGGGLHASIRVLRADSVLFFGDIGEAFVTLPDVFLRSAGQVMFWGTGASAVGCSMEIEGEGVGVAIGDDALISGGVWVRTHDMHAIHDLPSGAQIGRAAISTVLERHVWLGQDAMLLGCERVGMGSIVGARSLVKGVVAPMSVVAGTPARTIRQGVSWGRDLAGMTEAERRALGLPALPEV